MYFTKFKKIKCIIFCGNELIKEKKMNIDNIIVRYLINNIKNSVKNLDFSQIYHNELIDLMHLFTNMNANLNYRIPFLS